MPSGDAGIVDYAGKKLTEGEIKECVLQLRELLEDITSNKDPEIQLPTPTIINNDIADKKFQNFRKDDSYLLRFLHCTDFSVHLAYRRVDDYCNLLSEHPDWFVTGSPSEHRSLIEQNTKILLPDVRDKVGRRVFIALLGAVDPSHMSPQQSAYVDELWLELVMDEPETQAAGLSIILDMKGYSWSMFRWLTPSNMKLGSRKADLYPCKELVYHVVNTSIFVNAAVKLVWPFLTAKLKEKFHFHFDDWESLHKYISPEVLPPEYGGRGPSLNFTKLNQWLYDNDSKVAENLRHHQVKKS